MPGPTLARRDPRLIAPRHSYLTDGTLLVQVLESDHSGVLAEDVRNECLLVSLEPIELIQKWRRVRPHPSITAAAWFAERAQAAPVVAYG